jgi:hypothetical protein
MFFHTAEIVNLNTLGTPFLTDVMAGTIGTVLGTQEGLFGRVFGTEAGLSALADQVLATIEHERYHASLVDWKRDENTSAFDHPHSLFLEPVFAQNDATIDNSEGSRIVAILSLLIGWDRYLINLLPGVVEGITCVLRNSCGQAYTYQLRGNSVCSC